MRHEGVVAMLVVALAGCAGAPAGEGWQDASPQLAALGVDSVRVMVRTPSQQQVELGDRARIHIGQVAVAESEGERSVSVSLNDHAFSQVVRPQLGTMSLTLDERHTDLQLDGTSPPAAALQLLADAKPLVQIVIALGVDVGMLTPEPATPAASPSPSPAPMPLTPPPPAPMAPPAPTTLCCSSVLVTTVGWAWFWEQGTSSMSCRRATDAANALCEIGTQYPCCGLPPQGCSDCINLGTGYYCYTAGYLQSKC